VGARTRGTHQLLRQGAALAESADDVVREIAPHLRAAPAPPPPHLSDLETALVAQLDAVPRSVDELIRRTGLAAGTVLETLLVLELRGVVRQLPGQCFARAASPAC
jgi:DNA processing protein